MAEQRYQAVLAVISDGETVTDVAARFGCRVRRVHNWLAKYEAGGLENLGDGSHRPRSCPHQMDAGVGVELAVLRRRHPTWGPRRLVYELAKQDITVSESAVYRALVRGNLIDPAARRPRDRKWKRWARGRQDTAGHRDPGQSRAGAAVPVGVRTGPGWPATSAVGVVCVNWQQVCLGVAAAGRPVGHVWVTDQVLQFYDGDQLLRTEKRVDPGKEVRVKRAQSPKGQALKSKRV